MTNTFKKEYNILEREILYQGVFRLVRLHVRHQLFDGTFSPTFTREVLERASAAAVLPYDPVLDRVILIEQFRPGALKDPNGPWQIEIPAGVFGQNEEPTHVAIREAKEEADCSILKLEPICDYFVSPGGCDEYIHLFYGQVDASTVQEEIFGLQDENENIRVLNLTAQEAFERMDGNQLKNAPTIITLQWLKLNRARLKSSYHSN